MRIGPEPRAKKSTRTKKTLAHNGERETKTPARLVLDAILATTPALYVNVASRPMVEIPFGSASEQREPWPIDSGRVNAEIAVFAYRLLSPLVLRDREVTQIIRVLEGLAWETRKAPTGIDEAFDEAPLLEALYTIVTDDSAEPFKGTISVLLQKLNDTARRLGIFQNGKGWPKGAAQLSKRLTDLSNQGVLARFGITFVRIEKARPRSVELSHTPTVDAGASAASEQRRDHNVVPENDFKKTDGGDGADAAVFHYLKAPPSVRRNEN